ncbi:MAG: hypothetical protein JWP75_1959 [Frondihabitans sp.]|nr:hypothetical protein [Frondihabitans sp.]
MSSPISSGTTARSWVIGAAIVAIVLGLIALFFPGASLLTVAILFGLALLAMGIFRLAIAIRGTALPTGARVFTGVFGAIVLIAGILCLIDPGQSLRILGIFIGIGWIFEGATGLVAGTIGSPGGRRVFPIIAGIVAIVAGLIMLFLPVLALSAFIVVAGIILIVIGVTMLLHLPRKAGNISSI